MGRKQYGGRAGGAQGGGDGEIYARACGPRKHGPGGSVHWSSMNGGGPSTYVAPDPKDTHAYKAERDGAFKAAVARAEKAREHRHALEATE